MYDLVQLLELAHSNDISRYKWHWEETWQYMGFYLWYRWKYQQKKWSEYHSICVLGKNLALMILVKLDLAHIIFRYILI